MDSEQRKEYNKQYYANNKERIISDLCQKVECPFCNRSVIKNNLMTHAKSAICLRTRERVLELAKFNKMKETI